MANDGPTVELDIPPNNQTPDAISMYSPDASEDVTTRMAETLETSEHQMYWEDIRFRSDGLTDRLSLTLTLEQMRRWMAMFEDYIHRRNKALDEHFRDAWCMYAVTVEKYPHRPVSLDDSMDPDPKERGRTPTESHTVATCWTERAAHDVRASVHSGEHPDFDPFDFDCEYYVRVDTVPLIGEDQTPPWEQDD